MSWIQSVSLWVLRLFSSATLDGRTRSASPEIEAEIVRAKERATCETVALAMIGQMIAAQAVYWVLKGRVESEGLLWWLLARQVLSVCRLVHGLACLHGYLTPGAMASRMFVVLAALDGLLWGVLGWYFTPMFRLDVAVVSISVLIGVAAMGAQMLYMNMPGAIVFIVPILVPNAFFAMGRHDDLGYFCLVAILGLTAMMLGETARSHRRTTEMLRLRLESEQVSKAKTEALHQAKLLADTKSRFVATMSHEMRTPLHGILGLIRLVQQASHDDQSARNLALIQGSGEHLLSVINDVLDFSKLETDGLSVHVQSFPLAGMVHDLAETSRVICQEKGLALDVLVELPRDEYVEGDQTRVRQVLHNLIGNAIKFTHKGTVGLHVWRDAQTSRVMFEVRDTGIGISPQEVARVFDAFHQADGTYQRQFGGTGLGLTISRELCQAMGGQLSCTSEVGRGSVFICELPLPAVAAPGAKPHKEKRASSLSRSSFAFDLSVLDEPHVLVVEDNPVNALVAQAELDRLGVRSTVVDNGFDAIEWLEREQADLILMDCEMPGMDGVETTRRIRERERQTGRQKVSIVALTANGADMYAERCVPAGMNGHLLKPFRPEELAHVLSRHLRVSAFA
jgi:signal transduction histidine kinase/ActR/RegA family two-component response regulator